MIGITSFGAYIPIYRLARDTIANSWERGSLKGERSVANNDEDSITMAVEAGSDCLQEFDRNMVDGLFFATSNAPYKEKLNAGLISTVLDLPNEIITADYANSLRAGTAAFKGAFDAVTAGSAKNVLITAADCRLAYPRSDQEQVFGDGAAAFAVGNNSVIATMEASFSINKEIVDVWRNDDDRYVKVGEPRFILNEGYMASMKEVISGILDKTNRKPSDITKLLVPSPDYRSHLRLAKMLEFNPEEQVEDTLLGSVGHCGVAHPLMLLVAALENANPEDTILMVSYGDGAEAVLLKVTEEITKVKSRRGIKKNVQSKRPLTSYEKFLSFRGQLEPVPAEPFRTFPSASVYWREQNSILRCHGSRCRQCGRSIFPAQRICFNCRSKDDYEEIRYAEQIGRVFTFSIDRLAGRSDDPVVVQTVFEMEDGARFYLVMTDCDPENVEIGQHVEFTFRKIYEGAGFHNYFWKCRPLRNGGM
jgi:3-hydroxy-3-methylglutaryl CoA synthase